MSISNDPILGGPVLDLLKNMFKGIFDGAVEYQNDYGKLKAVQTIYAEDKEGVEYEFKLNFSPIKTDKADNVFYVTLESDDLDVSKLRGIDKINKKAFTIDKTNKDAFQTQITKFFKANHLEEITAKEYEGEDDEDMSEADYDVYSDEGKVIFTIHLEVDNEEVPNGLTQYHVDVNPKAVKEGVKLWETKFTVKEADPAAFEEAMSEYASSVGIDLLDDNIDELLAEGFRDLREDADEDEAENEGAEEVTTSTYVTLRKIEGSDEIYLMNIGASTNIAGALAAVEEITASDEFVEQLPEGDSSYKLTASDDYYDIDEASAEEVSEAVSDGFATLSKSGWDLTQSATFLMLDLLKSNPEKADILSEVVNSVVDIMKIISKQEAEDEIKGELGSTDEEDVVKALADFISNVDAYSVNLPDEDAEKVMDIIHQSLATALVQLG